MEKAIEIQPNFSSLRRDLGMLQFQRQNYQEAAAQLGKAVELGLKDSALYNFLGISLSRTGKLKDAAQNYRNALILDPGMAEAHLNLAFVYERLHQDTSASREYAQACRPNTAFCQYVKP